MIRSLLFLLLSLLIYVDVHAQGDSSDCYYRYANLQVVFFRERSGSMIEFKQKVSHNDTTINATWMTDTLITGKDTIMYLVIGYLIANDTVKSEQYMTQNGAIFYAATTKVKKPHDTNGEGGLPELFSAVEYCFSDDKKNNLRIHPLEKPEVVWLDEDYVLDLFHERYAALQQGLKNRKTAQ